MASRYARYLTAARLKAGFETPQEAAKATGIPYQSVIAHELETASGRSPKVEALASYAEAYGTSIEALIGRRRRRA